jgi:hypothetical protein
VALLAVTVIVAAPTGGFCRYQISLRRKTLPVEPAAQEPALLSSIATRQVRVVLPSLTLLTTSLPFGVLLSTLSEIPTIKILLPPEPIVCDHANVALVLPELGVQLEPVLPEVAVAQSALLSRLIAA